MKNLKIKKISVGSSNPVKVSAVIKAISLKFPNAKVISTNVSSEVSSQPATDQETKKGSQIRAKKALTKSKSDIGIGIEGGIFIKNNQVWNTVWCCVVSSNHTIFVNGERFLIPSKLSKKLLSGEEMGPAMDILTNRSNIKHKEGMLGIVTSGWVSRLDSYKHLVKLAIGRLLTIDWP